LDSLSSKLVAGGRGGYCFEQNMLFGHVLRELGFDVANLAARVIWDRGDDGDRARTHMLLFVQLAEGPYLCDVGFGGLTMTAPVRLEPGVEQPTPHERLRVQRDGRELLLQARLSGDWKSLYRFDLQEQRAADIEVLNFYVSQYPESPFRSTLMAARAAEDRRYGLRNGRLTVRFKEGRSEERALGSVAELKSVLAEPFGIRLPDDGTVDAALERVLGESGG
jgi:N-hydroxyarylamine O-acetyltransferase